MIDLEQQFIQGVFRLSDAVSEAQMAVFKPILEARGVQVVDITSQAELTELLAKHFQGAAEIQAVLGDSMELEATADALKRAGLVQLQASQIRITQTPAGEAPLEFRDQWVGVKFSGIKLPLDAQGGEVQMLSGDSVPARNAWAVLPEQAFTALRNKSPAAADWFAANWPPELPVMTFGADEVEIVNK